MIKALEQAKKDLSIINTTIDNEFELDSNQAMMNFISILKGRYTSLIGDFSSDLEKSYKEPNFYGAIETNRDLIKSDIFKIKGKIETFINTEGLDYSINKDTGRTVINNIPTNTITSSNTNANSLKNEILIDAKSIIKTIENNTSLSEEEIQLLISKIKEIEDIVKNKELSKPKKWQLIKDISKYFLDKGLDVAIAFLPYITQSVTLI